MRRSVYNNTLVKASLNPAARTDGTVDGTGVDRLEGRNVFRTAMVIVQTGAITDGTHTIEVQDSDDDSTYAAVASEFLEGTEPAIDSDDDNTVFEIGYLGPKRYLRASVTTASSTTGGIFGAVVVLGQPNHPPVSRS